jgi:hypothetical protein
MLGMIVIWGLKMGFLKLSEDFCQSVCVDVGTDGSVEEMLTKSRDPYA